MLSPLEKCLYKGKYTKYRVLARNSFFMGLSFEFCKEYFLCKYFCHEMFFYFTLPTVFSLDFLCNVNFITAYRHHFHFMASNSHCSFLSTELILILMHSIPILNIVKEIRKKVIFMVIFSSCLYNIFKVTRFP